MDLILRNARITDTSGARPADIGIARGRIVAIEPRLDAEGREIDGQGCLVAPGLIETHIHLDKSYLLGRCKAEKGDLDEAIGEVARAKTAFTPEDVYARGKRTLEQCLLNGTTHMRTQLEVDPGIGLRGLQGIRPLIDEYKWAIDIEICIFPQEGLLNNPGTDALMVEALKTGGSVVGAAPYTDTNPHGQIDRFFAMARQFDIDIDMHLDFGPDPNDLDLEHVCRLTDMYRYGGRVAIGHVTKLSAAPAERFEGAAKRLADAGVALTVLPATDLYLMGRHMHHNVMRGITPAHKLLHAGVNCTLSTNNVLNPFTPFGDCSLIRIANLYANVAQVGGARDLKACFEMITTLPARLMNAAHYGVAVGHPADLVVVDSRDPALAVAEVAQPLFGLKRGRRSFTRAADTIHRP